MSARYLVRSTRRRVKILLFILLLIIGTLNYMYFFKMFNGDKAKDYMSNQDYLIIADAKDNTLTTPLKEIFDVWPYRAERIIMMKKTINNEIYQVTIIYYNNYWTAYKAYREVFNNIEDISVYSRGNAVILGDKRSADTLRWRLWVS